MPILQQPPVLVGDNPSRGGRVEGGKLDNGDVIDIYSSHKSRYERVEGS
jgi:hypothetical protein